jgi:hypothetical protein
MGGGRHRVYIHHGDEASNQEWWQEAKQIPRYLASQMSKWCYDTSTGTAIGATRCGSFVGKGFGLLVVSYG